MRLIFNKPAVRQFVEGKAFLQTKLEDGVIMFMVSSDEGAELTPRARGGFEAVVEGDVGKALKESRERFFILRRHSKDWLVAVPFVGKGPPPKFEPQVRLERVKAPRARKQAASRRSMTLWAWIMTNPGGREEIVHLPGTAMPLVSPIEDDMRAAEPAVHAYVGERARPARLAKFTEDRS